MKNRCYPVLLVLLLCLPLLHASAFAIDDNSNLKDEEISVTSAENTLDDGDITIIIPTFSVEPVGETTKAVQYGESIQLQVVVIADAGLQFSYSWIQFDREANWWKPIESSDNRDTLILENVTEDCEVMCNVTDESGDSRSITFKICVSKSSDKCGDNLEWSLENGVLTITGIGEMYNYYAQSGFGPPWYDRMSEIQTVIVSYGVESIGEYAFTDAENLTNVSFPDSTWIIGDHAFQNTGLYHVYLPDAPFLNIGWYSFAGCANLQTISIGKTPEKILGCAFANCPNLTEITFRGRFPYAGAGNPYYGVTATINYPCNIIEYYKQDYPPDYLENYTDEQLQNNFDEMIRNDPIYDGLTLAPFHEEVIDPSIPPRCTTTGLIEGKYCSICGEVLVEQKSIRPTGHSFENGICTVCGEQEELAYQVDIGTSLKVPAELIEDNRVNTVEKILLVMHQKARDDFKQLFGVELTESGLFDYEISASVHIGDSYIPLDDEIFPQNGISFIIPYPAGTGQAGFDFLVHHLTHTGEIESVQFEKTDAGLKVTVLSMSPFVVSAMPTTIPTPTPTLSPTPNPTPTVSPTPTSTLISATSPETADKQNIGIWCALCIISGLTLAGLIFAKKKMD